MFTLDQVVPWGRSFEEYRRMFALSDEALTGRILGCGDGPASFNAEATRRGTRVVSADPIYRFDAGQLGTRIEAAAVAIAEQVRKNEQEFVWDEIRSVDELVTIRLDAMKIFLDDYERGKREGRYVDAELPTLPFADRSFDLAVCSHFLFLYTDHLTCAFHREAALELCRVAPEVRIFPLLALGGRQSPYIEPVTEWLLEQGYDVSIEVVRYEFQRGGNQMMRVRSSLAALQLRD
jgi:hypothetical protein